MQMEVTNRLSMLWGCPEKKGLWLRLDLPQEGASRRVCQGVTQLPWQLAIGDQPEGDSHGYLLSV